MKKEIYIKLFFSLILFLFLFTLSACDFSISNNAKDGISKYGTYFDTFVSITIYGLSQDEAEPILDSSMKIFSEYESMLSAQIEGSDIYNINNSQGQTVKVSPDTIELLDKALYYSKTTNGLFDISVYSILQKYNFHTGEEKIPTKEEITQSLQHINYKNISIDDNKNTVTLLDPQTQIEIGGIAKGFIADKVAAYLNEKNIIGAIINIGGDISTIGNKSNGQGYQIGISDPKNSNEILCGLSITNKSVATSGTYIRSFYLDGEFYHHILNPQTGYPVKTDLVSTTVISNSATDCDTLCTILILLGSRDALSYIESIPATEAILVKEDGTILKSSGADQYIVK